MKAATLDLLEKAAGDPKLARAIAEANEIELDARKDELATKNDIRVMELRLIKWTFGMLLSQALVVLGGVWFMMSAGR